MKKLVWLVLLTLTALSTHSLTYAQVDSDLPEYAKTSGIAGNLSSVGSDTLANLMTLWAEEYKRFYPGVNIQIQAAGSSTAPPALTQSTANFGPMSRPMKDSELQAFEDVFGYKPTAVPVAIDAIAVYVHRDNPIQGMTFAQVDAVFSSTRKCGANQEITSWSQLGVAGRLADMDIQIFGRNSVSGTYGYFKSKALCKGDYRSNVNEQPGSSAVVQSVTSSVNGIGYSGIGYRTAGVRTVPIAGKGSKDFYDATPQNALSGNYPIARFLYVYVNKHPNKPLTPLELEFMKMVLSRQGQGVVEKDGYVALPESVAAKHRAMLF